MHKLNKFLIVGLGTAGKRHLEIVKQTFPDAQIKVLRHKQSKEPSSLTSATLYSVDEAINFRPDVAIISNPANMHLEISQTLAELGTHILVEKPLSNSLHGVQDLLETCKKQNVKIAVAYNLRFLNSLNIFKEIIESGEIGRILSVRCEAGFHLPKWRTEIDYKKTVSASKDLGGGALLELSHEIDYLIWIFGSFSWVSATSAQLSDLDINVEDIVSIIFGINSKEEKSTEIIGSLNLDLFRQDKSRLCLAIGSAGSIKWDGIRGTVEILRENDEDWKLLHKDNSTIEDTYSTQWQSFLDCIESDTEPLVTGRDGESVMKAIASIQDSIVKEKIVHLTTEVGDASKK